ncbi:hypothetical protein [Lysobacter enzymogenes]|uniref:hypothetical protein n=1 Tax=Lysobacter enzymogenes TaxID=69 RepID=UPI00144265BD|nr:hypothetical protein [Lysobacter enzymogenes]
MILPLLLLLPLPLLLQLPWLLLVLAFEPDAVVSQPRRARAWMRACAMGQDAPYGAAPRRVLDLVAFDLKPAFFFGYFLLARCQKKVTKEKALFFRIKRHYGSQWRVAAP